MEKLCLFWCGWLKKKVKFRWATLPDQAVRKDFTPTYLNYFIDDNKVFKSG